jgi:SAM-dependent methyltransferase
MNPESTPTVRSHYKKTWQNLALGSEGAVIYVSGYDDEDQLHATMEDTLGILRQTVGIRPDDVFLEIGCGVGRVGRGLAPFVREWIGCDVSSEMIRQARRKTLARKLAKCQREGMTCLAAAASLGVSYKTALRASQAHGIVWRVATDQGALYDALDAENAKPPRERAARPQIAARVGCTVGAVHDALHSLGWRWSDERAAALRDEIRSFAAANPDATPTQIARCCDCDVRAVHRALK